MTNRDPRRSPNVLRRIAALLIRSEDARFILDDLDELLARDIARGMPLRRARWRYARNMIASAWSVGRARLRRRRVGSVSWLDVKLGLRMLVKYPAVTLVGGLGMAVAIAIGAILDATAAGAVDSTLPFEEGERVVAIENWDTEVNNQERQILHDFVTWRAELGSVEELGAWRPIERNLITPDGRAGLVTLAEITGSGFRLARVPPLLGRTLVEADEREGAPPVVVIGYDVWRGRFAGDPDIVGREVRLGRTVHTVIGVMPEGFAFPVNHRFWVPLRADASDYERRRGPGIFVFGRLAPGATLEEARAELTTIGRRAAAAFPATHERLRPRVVPYTLQFLDDMEGWEIAFTQLLITLLLVVVCVNVAILVYARTVTRRGEIAMRSALGASRRRIVGQLFVEAFVLSAGAAIVGLVLARLALRQVDALVEQILFAPFWIDFGLSTRTILYVVGLAVLAAVLVGVVPALKATGRRVQTGLRHLPSGGTGMRMGRTWTVLIVAQVGVAVAVLPAAVHFAGEFLRYGFADPGFAAEEFLTARLEMDRETLPGAGTEADRREFLSRFGDLQAELVRRLEAEPGVAGVTFTLNLPGEEYGARVEVDGTPPPADSASGRSIPSGSAGYRVGISRGVDVGFFDTFDIPVLAGRRFDAGDLGAAMTTVIVNRTFVQQVLGGGNALGRRVRYVDGARWEQQGSVDPERRYEIVGVVSDFPAKAMEPGRVQARMYHPIAPGRAHPVRLVLRVRGIAPAALAGRLREIGAALDPTLQLHAIRPLNEVLREEQMAMRLGALAIALLTLSVLLLCAAGIHALMSFTVARRRREIGIRAALGADPRRLLAGIFSRALGQLAIGVVVGVPVATLLLTADAPLDRHGVVLLVSVSAFMMAVGLLAALGPARRGLRIQPTEALREE